MALGSTSNTKRKFGTVCTFDRQFIKKFNDLKIGHLCPIHHWKALSELYNVR